jgi:hypothetical protein
MSIRGIYIAATSLSAMLVLASCQATVGVAGGGNGAALGMTTTIGHTPQGTYMTRNLMRAVSDPSAPGRFEVRQKAGEGGSGYWCAAGQYVIEGRRMGPTTRIYLEQPIGPGKVVGGTSIGFTVAPDASLSAAAEAQENGLIMSMNRIGENWSAEHARSQCRGSRFGLFFWG